MPLKVIGAGFGRTGTLSLKLALERLGFGPCHHMVEVFADPAQVDFWNRAADGGIVDWDAFYSAYPSTVDWPGCAFAIEHAARYPDAKVILSWRDPESWFRSMSETIFLSMQQMNLGMEAPADHPMRFGKVLIHDGAFGGDFSRDHAIAVYERHNAAVKAAIAPERLLVFSPGDGWEPLCAFLGVPVPDEPYPRTNSSDEFWAHAEKAKALMEG